MKSGLGEENNALLEVKTHTTSSNSDQVWTKNHILVYKDGLFSSNNVFNLLQLTNKSKAIQDSLLEAQKQTNLLKTQHDKILSSSSNQQSKIYFYPQFVQTSALTLKKTYLFCLLICWLTDLNKEAETLVKAISAAMAKVGKDLKGEHFNLFCKLQA